MPESLHEQPESAKQWLMRGWKLDQEIEALRRAKQEAWERTTSVTAQTNASPVRATPDPHKFEQFAILGAAIDERIAELTAVETEILAAIARVPDGCSRTLLTERYVCFRTWEQVAVDMGYSLWHVKSDMHQAALDAIAEVLQLPTQSHPRL